LPKKRCKPLTQRQNFEFIIYSDGVCVFVSDLRLQRFEKTNEMLTNCNALSMNHLKTTSQELKKHTQMLTELRKDLDSTFKRIATIRSKIKVQYPDFQKSKDYIFVIHCKLKACVTNIIVVDGLQVF
jgi:hypothetical protein